MPPHGRIRYWPEFIQHTDADRLERVFGTEIDWQERSIRLFGRDVRQPRLIAFYGDSGIEYRYSGTRWTASEWSPALADIRDRLTAGLGICFNSVLCNLYRDGSDSMGWHADDEPELGTCPVIASISLGASRRFILRRHAESALQKRERIEFVPAHGSLLVMQGDIQEHWQHAVPRTRNPVGPRINLTFRRIRMIGG